MSKSSLPSYRRHRQSGQAIVTLTDGIGGPKDFLLGPYDTAESKSENNRLVAEWVANCRTYRRPQESKNDLTIGPASRGTSSSTRSFRIS